VLGLLGAYMRAVVFAEKDRDEEELLNSQMDVVVTQPSRIFSRRSCTASTGSTTTSTGENCGSTSSSVANGRIAPGVSSPFRATAQAELCYDTRSGTEVRAFATFETISSLSSDSAHSETYSPRNDAGQAVARSSAPLASVKEASGEAAGEQDEGGTGYRLMVSGSSNVQAARVKELPLSLVFSDLKTELAVGFCFVAFWCIAYYTIFVWHAYLLTSEEMIAAEPLTESQGWWLVFFSNASLIILLPIGGMLGDWKQKRYQDQLSRSAGEGTGDDTNAVLTCSRTHGHRRIMIAACISLAAIAPFAYMRIAEATLESCVIGQALLVIPVGIFGGNIAVVVCDLFPHNARYTGVGLTYNIANAVVAGTAALVQTHLVMLGQTGGPENGDAWSWHSTFVASDMIMAACTKEIDGSADWWCRLFSLWDWACTVAAEVLDREFHDSRLFPGVYLQSIALVATCALSCGVHRCHVRKQSANLHALQRQTGHVTVAHYPSGVPANFPTIEYVQV